MKHVVDRPTVREAVAAAISGGDLDRSAALGSAQLPRTDEGIVLTRRHDESLPLKERLQIVERDGKDLGLELAALLLRAKYANDHRGVGLANFRFALRLRVRARRQIRKPRHEQMVIALASQSIAEWLADRCEKCKGTGIRGARMGGMQEGLKACAMCAATGMVVYRSGGLKLCPRGDGIEIQCPACRGMRYMIERKRVHQRLGRTCPACAGDGSAPARHADRARALGVSIEIYERHWQRWFVWAAQHLTALDKTLVINLRCELSQGYSPSP